MATTSAAHNDLPLRVLPFGGLGKIGMNCMLVGHRDRWVMVDCGVMFPPNTMIGADKILPDLETLAAWRDKVEAVVITHGHEDHIGALPWVLPLLDPKTPVWASGFTTQLIKRRLSEYNRWNPDRMRRYEVPERFDAGPFEIEPIRVTHSLPDCASLVLRCEDGTIVHTGDWKIDEDPMDGEHFDREAFARVGDEGVSLLLSDSTNVLSPGRTLGERVVAENMHKTIAAWPGRVVVAQFSSNLHRMQGLAEAAVATNRKIALVGRSLHTYLEAAGRVGRVPVPPSLLIDIDAVKDLPDDEVIIACTGSQGEPRAAMVRAARGAHPRLKLGRGDLVIHSARVIPGNEAEVYDMFNQLAMRGAELIAGRATGLHASGHARQDELGEMIDLLRPACFVPVHGEYTFLRKHAQLGRDLGVPEVAVIQNGEIFGVATDARKGNGKANGKRGHRIVDSGRVALVDLEPMYNDGKAIGDAEAVRLKERKRIAWNGIVIVDLAITPAGGGKRAGVATVDARALWVDAGRLLDVMAATAERAVASCPPHTPLSEITEAVRSSVRAAARKATDKKPEVVVILHQGRAE